MAWGMSALGMAMKSLVPRILDSGQRRMTIKQRVLYLDDDEETQTKPGDERRRQLHL
jgi:hypothetical protein